MASAVLSQTDIRVDDNPSITVAEMNAKLRRVEDLGLVIIDYLQLMTGSGYGKSSENRVQVVGEISRSLKIMAKELNVPVICLSQLSRAVESRTDKRPPSSRTRTPFFFCIVTIITTRTARRKMWRSASCRRTGTVRPAP